MKQVVKWTAEGAVKGKPSILRRMAPVSSRGYAGIPLSENQGGTVSM